MITMEKYVFAFAGVDAGKLKAVLEGDSLADISFARIGYVLRDGKSLGIDAGQVVFFKAEPDAAKILIEKLKVLASFKEVAGADKEKVISAIEGAEDDAAAGFGNIFG